jgi:NADPH:quinone reductase
VRAARCAEYGPPDLVTVEEVADPVPGDGEVLVDIELAAVNFADTLIVSGEYQMKAELPFTPGSEFAGTVAAAGADSTFVPGDRVFGATFVGAFAEQVAVPSMSLKGIPENVSFRDAAAFGVAYSTAYHALRTFGSTQPGDWVLVLGAAGGVGLAAGELAGILGARVVAAVSGPQQAEVCRDRGADAVVDVEHEDLKTRVRQLTDGGADVVIDTVGGDLTETAIRAIRWGGRHVVIGFASGEIPRIPANLLLLKGPIMRGFDIRALAQYVPEDFARNNRELDELFAAGRLHPHVGAVFPLEETGEALGALAERHRTTGKVLVDPRAAMPESRGG